MMALAAVSLANWAERGRFGVPEDGVMWTDSEAGVSASTVESESPAALVGVRSGDILISIGGRPVVEALDATRYLTETGAWSRTLVASQSSLAKASAAVVWPASSWFSAGPTR